MDQLAYRRLLNKRNVELAKIKKKEIREAEKEASELKKIVDENFKNSKKLSSKDQKKDYKKIVMCFEKGKKNQSQNEMINTIKKVSTENKSKQKKKMIHSNSNSNIDKDVKNFDKKRRKYTLEPLNYEEYPESDYEYHLIDFSILESDGENLLDSSNDNVSADLEKSKKSKSTKNKKNIINESEVKMIIDQIMKMEKNDVDNDYQTNEYFLKLHSAEFNTAIYAIFTIIVGVLYHNLTYFYKENVKANTSYYELCRNFLLIMSSVSVIFFIVESSFRYLIQLNLDKKSGNVLKNTSFFSLDYFGGMLIEVIIALLHPNILTKNIKFTTNKEIYGAKAQYELNDLFLIITLMRVYIIFRYFIVSSKFYSARCNRIGRMIGSKLTRLYVIKCIVIDSPIYFLIVVSIVLIVTFALVLRIVESRVYTINDINNPNDNDYRPFWNCVWNVVVTMTGVGYGDYYPITIVGRLVNCFNSLFGTCLTSFMFVVLQNSLAFNENEEKAFSDKEKKELKENFDNITADYFRAAFQYNVRKIIYRKSIKNKSSLKVQALMKKKMIAALEKRIEKQKIFRNYLQYFRNSYDLITDDAILKDKLDIFQKTLNEKYICYDLIDKYLRLINETLDDIEMAYYSSKQKEYEKLKELEKKNEELEKKREEKNDNNKDK